MLHAVPIALPLLSFIHFAPFCCCLGVPEIFVAVFCIWMLVDCLLYETSDKLVWVLVIIFLHGLGALLYLLMRYNKNRLPLSGGGGAGTVV